MAVIFSWNSKGSTLSSDPHCICWKVSCKPNCYSFEGNLFLWPLLRFPLSVVSRSFTMMWFSFMFSYSLGYYLLHAGNYICKIICKGNLRPRIVLSSSIKLIFAGRHEQIRTTLFQLQSLGWLETDLQSLWEQSASGSVSATGELFRIPSQSMCVCCGGRCSRLQLLSAWPCTAQPNSFSLVVSSGIGKCLPEEKLPPVLRYPLGISVLS